ncbi:tetratricopeptide repeat protein [Nitrosomonas sp.]|uniref:tetratricopeptide repeat protein n=1 Tax=Nitrosomonas sp. TaxID=42353 RepID=UPI0035B00E9E
MKYINVFIAIAMVLMVACSSTKNPPFPSQSANAGSWSGKTGVKLLADIGGYQYTITTRNPVAQAYFNQGLIMSFAFNHNEAVRAFLAAQQLDEACAMCYWGEALALGPNMNVTSNGQAVLPPEVHAQAYEAIQKALQLKPLVSAKERHFIDALAVRYSNDTTSSRSELDIAYMNAMRELYQQYPDDNDAASLFAESMMTTMPWDYWIDPETPKELTREVIHVLETVLRRSPKHPLALHLYIHAVEASSSPRRAENAADTLLDLIPDAGHLVHMPSHIYWRIGRYHDAAEANARAVAVDETYIANCKVQSFYTAAYYPHNLHFLWAAYSMEGRSEAAIAAADKVAASVSFEMIQQFPVVEFVKTIPVLTLTNFGKWQEVLQQPQPSGSLQFSQGIWRYARAIAYLKLGDPEAAQAEYLLLSKIRTNADLGLLDEQDYPATQLLQIADELVQAEILMARKDYAKAIAAYKAAVLLQDQLPYMEPPFWYYPIQLSLGKALIEAGDFIQAEMVYRDNLKKFPKNGWALLGLKQSLQMQGKDYGEIQKAFDQAWRNADVSLTASRF